MSETAPRMTEVSTKSVTVEEPPATPTSPQRIESPTSLLEWLQGWMLPGLGMFSNAYMILAVGNIGHLLAAAQPECWGEKEHPACSDTLRDSIRYSVFVGIVIGMLGGGVLGDRLGRRVGLITAAAVMLFGSLLIVATPLEAEPSTAWTWFSMSLAVFGLGVGCEYPLAASASAEKADAEAKERAKQRALASQQSAFSDKQFARKNNNRGKRMSLSFSMQGLGNFVNTVTIVLLLVLFNQTGSKIDPAAIRAVWRLQYLGGTVILVFLTYYRYKHVEESKQWLERTAKKVETVPNGTSGAAPQDQQSTKTHAWIFLRLNWHRMIGTAFGWMMWDLTFYGNKIFQTDFISLFVPDATVFELLLYTSFNSGVALCSYHLAAHTIDFPWMGRRRMQMMGFTVLATSYGLLAFLVGKGSLGIIMLLYFAATIWGQWGPNATTWIFPSECYPTTNRALGHGLSAAGGKFGALNATFFFNMMGPNARFLTCSIAAAIGLLLTVVFLPDTRDLDLDKNDTKWESQLEEYRRKQKEREECHVRSHKSWFERHVLRTEDVAVASPATTPALAL